MLIDESFAESVKSELRSRLAEARAPSAQRSLLNQEIVTARAVATPESAVRGVTATIALLLHLERHESALRATTVASLAELARGFLVILFAKASIGSASELRYLEAELSLALSQAHRRAGDHWRAAWDLAAVDARTVAERQRLRAVSSLATGSRHLRLGQTREAKIILLETCDMELLPGERHQALLLLAQVWRLSGKLSDARAILAGLKSERLSARVESEASWETLCCDAQEEKSVAKIVRAVKPKGTHRSAVYLAEAFLWAAASREARWLKSVAKPSSAMQYEGFGFRALGTLKRAVLVIETMTDSSTPMLVKRAKLGDALATRHLMPTVDKEALFLAAAFVWLRRARCSRLSLLVGAEYRHLCTRLSDGETGDLFSVT